MPATVQPVIVTPTLPLLLAFYKALLGAVEISRVPEDGPAFYVGLQIGNAELGIVTDGEADIAAPQRILLNVNVADLGVGGVESLLEHVEPLAHIQDPTATPSTSPNPFSPDLPRSPTRHAARALTPRAAARRTHCTPPPRALRVPSAPP